MQAALSCGDCEIDVSGLEFIDVSGLRAIVRAASERDVRLMSPRPIVRRGWEFRRFADDVPAVRLLH